MGLGYNRSIGVLECVVIALNQDVAFLLKTCVLPCIRVWCADDPGPPLWSSSSTKKFNERRVRINGFLFRYVFIHGAGLCPMRGHATCNTGFSHARAYRPCAHTWAWVSAPTRRVGRTPPRTSQHRPPLRVPTPSSTPTRWLRDGPHGRVRDGGQGAKLRGQSPG